MRYRRSRGSSIGSAHRSFQFSLSFDWYCFDRDFGPFFLKFCRYFPYNAKLCLNGHEYAKQPNAPARHCLPSLGQRLRLLCRSPTSAKRLRATGTPSKSMACCAAGWLACRIPSPHKTGKPAIATISSSCKRNSPSPRFWTAPSSGRIFFEEIIRENLDLGRPDKVQLIFNRRITRRTPGVFRTRVITDRGDPVPPRRLQELAHQAILQTSSSSRRSRSAHRDHHQ